jgi:hypothetical protein
MNVLDGLAACRKLARHSTCCGMHCSGHERSHQGQLMLFAPRHRKLISYSFYSFRYNV